ncbi:hypothetical protein [Streptomyces sp. NPDC050759]|uniref:hypothetical protein n=1 Tax=Streptomyces sp. NPDC050759 TaxID=3365635 RepID=UPI00378CF4D4
MTHVIHMAGMALVIHVIHVIHARCMVVGLLAVMAVMAVMVAVVAVAAVAGMSRMVAGAVAVVQRVVVMALVVGHPRRRAVMVPAVALIVPVPVVPVVPAVRMAAGLAPRGLLLVGCVGRTRIHRSVREVPPRRVERVRDLPGLLHHNPQSGLRHRPLDAFQPLRVPWLGDTADDQQVGGGRSARYRPSPSTHLRFHGHPDFRRSWQRDHQHRRALHRGTPQKALQVHRRAPSRQA